MSQFDILEIQDDDMRIIEETRRANKIQVHGDDNWWEELKTISVVQDFHEKFLNLIKNAIPTNNRSKRS